MLFWTIVKVGLKSLLANKLRSLLAMLGIIIGVGAVIAMLAMGAGAKGQIMDHISSMGTNLLIVRPGQAGSRGVMSGTTQTLTLEDAEALVQGIAGVARVAPVVNGSAQLKYLNQNSRTNVVGTSVTYLPVRNFEVEHGRTLTEQEVEGMARSAILGPTTAEDLFETDDPIGKTVKINGINFKVVGVLKSRGDQGWFNPDDQVIVPYAVAMKQLFGLDYLREIDIQADDDADLKEVQEAITLVLRKRHRLQEGTEDDFHVRNQADIIETASEVSQTFTVLLAGIASISLLVGGIGIMNIMLVTVTERTREIGVRMAIGAKRKNIRMQFLAESLIISGIGGLIGVGAGFSAAAVVSHLTRFSTAVELKAVLLSLAFSAAVGVFFGYYPARRAAMLNPVEALRYE